MFYLLLLPFALQVAGMLVDEFYFHYKRGLPKWEVYGHPVDTLAFLACFVYIRHYPFSLENLKGYLALAAFSCLLITKDEIVHHKLCSSGEMWLHACLFILHPLLLLSAGIFWFQVTLGEQAGTQFMHCTSEQIAFLQLALPMQIYIVGFFGLYQFLYWGIEWRKLSRSIMNCMTN